MVSSTGSYGNFKCEIGRIGGCGEQSGWAKQAAQRTEGGIGVSLLHWFTKLFLAWPDAGFTYFFFHAFFFRVLKNDQALCATKLQRATDIINGLGGEKQRWTDTAANLGVVYDTLTGKWIVEAPVCIVCVCHISNFHYWPVCRWRPDCLRCCGIFGTIYCKLPQHADQWMGTQM